MNTNNPKNKTNNQTHKMNKTTPTPQLNLEEIIGLTTTNSNGLASCASNSKFAYVAACVVVLYDVDSCSQSQLMVANRKPKALRCVAMTGDAKFIAAGESGEQPSILLWDGATKAIICELKGHQFGVASTAFSPDGRHLVSVGSPRDGNLFLWDWRNQILLTKTKAFSSCSAASSVCFTLDSKYIVTAGKNHLNFWKTPNSTTSRRSSRPTLCLIQGKPNALGKYKGCSFVAVSPPSLTNNPRSSSDHGHKSSSLYALTDTGTLLLLTSGLSISKTVKLKVDKCFDLSVSKEIVACACSNGTVKLLTVSLIYAGNLCYRESNTTKKRKAEECVGTVKQDEFQHLPPIPDAVACRFSTSNKLVVMYDDRTLYIWDIQDVDQPVRCCILVSHKTCILDIASLPCENMHDPSIACIVKGCSGGVSFATCSADGTVRLWDLVSPKVSSGDSLFLDTNNNFNIVETCGAAGLVSTGIFERDSVASKVISSGFRSIAASSDGRYLAAGDCLGNIHIFNLYASKYKCIQNAHDGEITSLSFSLASKDHFVSGNISKNNVLLASGGRDRMLHLYDVGRDFELIGSKDGHSDNTTSIKLNCNNSKLISSSANRSLVFWDVDLTNPEAKIMCCHRIASQGTINDITVDLDSEIAITVGQDKKINAFCISSGKLLRSFTHSDHGEPIRVSIDPSCSYLACAYSSGYICLYDYMTGEIAAQAVGHSDVITGTIFLPDCRHLVSVAGDGCVFLWKLPGHLTSRILQKMLKSSQDYCPLSPEGIGFSTIRRKINSNQISSNPWLCSKDAVTKASSWKADLNAPDASEFVFSVSRLPKWAQSKVSDPCSILADHNSSLSKQDARIQHQISLDVQAPVYSYSHDSRSPSDQESKKSEGCISRTLSDSDADRSLIPATLQRNSSFSFDNRWLTIHTVCFDLQSSPEFREMNNQRANGYVAAEDLAGDTNNERKRIKPSAIKRDFELGKQEETESISIFNQRTLDDLGSPHANVKQVTVCKSSQNLGDLCNMTPTKLESDLNQDVLPIIVDSLEKDSQAERRNSSPRKTCSTRYVNGRGLLQNKGLIGITQPQNSHSDTLGVSLEGNPHIELLEGPSLGKDDCKQEVENATISTSSEFLTSNSEFNSAGKSINTGISQFKFQGDLFDRLDQLERVTACREALSYLETAAETAFDLFSKISILDFGEDTSSGHSNDQFYSESSERLSLLQDKIKEVARLTQPANCGS